MYIRVLLFIIGLFLTATAHADEGPTMLSAEVINGGTQVLVTLNEDIRSGLLGTSDFSIDGNGILHAQKAGPGMVLLFATFPISSGEHTVTLHGDGTPEGTPNGVLGVSDSWSVEHSISFSIPENTIANDTTPPVISYIQTTYPTSGIPYATRRELEEGQSSILFTVTDDVSIASMTADYSALGGNVEVSQSEILYAATTPPSYRFYYHGNSVTVESGTYTVPITVTDLNGNIATSSADVVIEDVSLIPEVNLSNVLFLPGIKGSRLYEDACAPESSCEKLLWEPGIIGNAMEDLFLDDQGKSVNHIYTKVGDILDTAGGTKYYQSFIEDMDEIVVSGDMNEWRSVAYDWRLSLQDILSHGTLEGDRLYYDTATSTPYIEQTLRELAGSSKTGKVTIVAHSNGGLVTKKLLQSLGDTETQALVDKVVFVAVPQLGAPQAVGTLLYGYREGIPTDSLSFVVAPDTARVLAEHSPMAYHLLPSAEYFRTVLDASHPLIFFDTEISFEKERTAYGNVINTTEEMGQFLSAEEGGRTKPDESDTKSANVLPATFFQYADDTHDSIDAWAAPSGVEVYQIAGWGDVETVAGIRYHEWYNPFTKKMGTLFTPLFTEDGDGVVPIPSALYMSTGTSNVHRFWVDLLQIREDTRKKYKHGNIFEADSMRSFLTSLFNDEAFTFSDYILESQPTSPQLDKKLIFYLHSPLTLTLCNSSGICTGINEDGDISEDIDGATYGEFGEIKYVIVPEGDSYTLTMNGLAEGSFTLIVEEVEGSEVLSSVTFADIPTTLDTVATLVAGDGIESVGNLQIDENGDGTSDTNLTPSIDDVVMYSSEEVTAPSTGGGGEGISYNVTYPDTEEDIISIPSQEVSLIPTALASTTEVQIIEESVVEEIVEEIIPVRQEVVEEPISEEVPLIQSPPVNTQSASVISGSGGVMEWFGSILHTVIQFGKTTIGTLTGLFK